MANKKVSLDEAEFAADCALGMYTQEELAARHGVSKSTVGKMISGQRRPEVRKLIAVAREHAAARAKQRVADLLVRAVDVVGELMNSDRPNVALAAAREMLNRGLGRPAAAVEGAAENRGLDEAERKQFKWLRWRAQTMDSWFVDMSQDTKRRMMKDLGLTRKEVDEASKTEWHQLDAAMQAEFDDEEEDENEDDEDYDDEDDDESLTGGGTENWGATSAGDEGGSDAKAGMKSDSQKPARERTKAGAKAKGEVEAKTKAAATAKAGAGAGRKAGTNVCDALTPRAGGPAGAREQWWTPGLEG
jgi:transcriptional regulator with XRE-family HTH domain